MIRSENGDSMEKKICVIGAFGFADLAIINGGQPVKTRELYYALRDHYGEAAVSCVETSQWKLRPLRMLGALLRNVPRSDVLIMLPAQNGIKVFSWLLQILKKRGAKLYYDVIGGWLPEMASKDAGLLARLKRFDYIWVETTSMQCQLKELGVQRVRVIPNFKTLEILSEEQLCHPDQPPYRLCTFSRVMEEKGITDAIEAVHRVNEQLGQKMYTLDVYGSVDAEYEEKFAQLQEQYADVVSYKGIADPRDSVRILKDYFALLFPTYYAGEGFAGTLLDAMASGVPVVASDWRCNTEVVQDGVTGVIYPARDVDALVQRLQEITQRVDWWNSLRIRCLEEAWKYQPGEVIKVIISDIEREA